MQEHEPTSSSQPNDASQPVGGGGQAQGGLEPSIGGLLSYLLGWIGGLIMLLTQKHPEVRFHGLQSILYNVALLVIYIALGILGAILGAIPGLGFISGLITLALFPLVGLAAFAGWILLCIKGYQLEHFKLPVIGDFAEQWSGYPQR